jgi:predicted phage-related endonuclease
MLEAKEDHMIVIPKPKHGSPEWLEARRRDPVTGACLFGASDAGPLMGVSPFVSRADLYVSKVAPSAPSEESEVFRRGNVLEPALVAEAGRILGVALATPSVMYREGRFIVTLDGTDCESQPQVVVEAKTTTRHTVRDASDLPPDWLFQGWAQQTVTNAAVFFAVLDRDLRISVNELPRNGKAVEELLSEAERFGAGVDSGQVPSDEFLSEMTAEQIASVWKPQPTIIELGAEAVEWLVMLEDARRAASTAEEQEKTARDALARLLLDNEVGTIGGEKVVSWKEQKGKVSLDAKALRADHPDLASRYERVGNPFRVMRIHRPKQ